MGLSCRGGSVCEGGTRTYMIPQKRVREWQKVPMNDANGGHMITEGVRFVS